MLTMGSLNQADRVTWKETHLVELCFASDQNHIAKLYGLVLRLKILPINWCVNLDDYLCICSV